MYRYNRRSSRARQTAYVIGGLIAAALVFLVGYMAIHKDEVPAYADGFSWGRSIDIEQYKALREKNGCPAPSGAYDIDRRTETRNVTTTKRVRDSEGNYTNKSTTRRESYDVCHYTINRWVYATSSVITGSKRNEIIWPETNVTPCASLALGCLREGARKAWYTVHIKADNGNKYACDTTPEVWSSTGIETRMLVYVYPVVGGIHCPSIKWIG